MVTPDLLISHRGENGLDQDRRQSQAGFVQEQDLGIGHQAAADGQHLLFSAAQGPGQLAAALCRMGNIS
jgi:hypothetical protein